MPNEACLSRVNKPLYPPVNSELWTPELFRQAVIDSLVEWANSNIDLTKGDIRKRLGGRFKLERGQAQRVLRILEHDMIVFTDLKGYLHVNPCLKNGNLGGSRT